MKLEVVVVVAIVTWVMSSIGIRMSDCKEEEGKKWAVLVAGSSGWDNYRHQADVCHAYQILKKGGVADENIIVFMYDDIAFDSKNPRPGVVINNPNGPDVYKGVPKDYTGKHVNKNNLFNVILANRTALTGGSGKVLATGPFDTIFIYYVDHGGVGLICMPDDDDIQADELMNVLKKKHAAKGYKYMVIYLEACESGSMFQGILPSNINIYATTSASDSESSYGIYCTDMIYPRLPPRYDTCLGDVYGISWMEDADKHDMSKESLEKQYHIVHRRTLYGNIDSESHVMQFGDKSISKFAVATFIGSDPHNGNRTLDSINAYVNSSPTIAVSQRDVRLMYLRHKVVMAPNALKKHQALKELEAELYERKHVDKSIRVISDILFGQDKSSIILSYVRPQHQPIVDDWDCFRAFMKTYEMHCGKLSRYGKRYSRAFANMCNAGITLHQLATASYQACPNSQQYNHPS